MVSGLPDEGAPECMPRICIAAKESGGFDEMLCHVCAMQAVPPSDAGRHHHLPPT